MILKIMWFFLVWSVRVADARNQVLLAREPPEPLPRIKEEDIISSDLETDLEEEKEENVGPVNHAVGDDSAPESFVESLDRTHSEPAADGRVRIGRSRSAPLLGSKYDGLPGFRLPADSEIKRSPSRSRSSSPSTRASTVSEKIVAEAAAEPECSAVWEQCEAVWKRTPRPSRSGGPPVSAWGLEMPMKEDLFVWHRRADRVSPRWDLGYHGRHDLFTRGRMARTVFKDEGEYELIEPMSLLGWQARRGGKMG